MKNTGLHVGAEVLEQRPFSSGAGFASRRDLATARLEALVTRISLSFMVIYLPRTEATCHSKRTAGKFPRNIFPAT